jgi:hypothetical protein
VIGEIGQGREANRLLREGRRRERWGRGKLAPIPRGIRAAPSSDTCSSLIASAEYVKGKHRAPATPTTSANRERLFERKGGTSLAPREETESVGSAGIRGGEELSLRGNLIALPVLIGAPVRAIRPRLACEG